MNYDLHKPCADCPFLRVGGIRLMAERIREIAGGMLDSQGRTFSCHRTVEYDHEGEPAQSRGEKHCAGALIFAEKNHNATQAMRIAERLGIYDYRKLRGRSLVFGSLREMLRTAITGRRRRAA